MPEELRTDWVILNSIQLGVWDWNAKGHWIGEDCKNVGAHQVFRPRLAGSAHHLAGTLSSDSAQGDRDNLFVEVRTLPIWVSQNWASDYPVGSGNFSIFRSIPLHAYNEEEKPRFSTPGAEAIFPRIAGSTWRIPDSFYPCSFEPSPAVNFWC